jgi:hypothetical protein
MRFDEKNYPDPAGLCHELHGMDLRFMLSVWSKISRDTELGNNLPRASFPARTGSTSSIPMRRPMPKARTSIWAHLALTPGGRMPPSPRNDLLGRDTAGAGRAGALPIPCKSRARFTKDNARPFLIGG